MVPRTISLVAIISLYLVLIQRIAGQSAGPSITPTDCTSDQIQNNDVAACLCHGSDNICNNPCPVTPSGLPVNKCLTTQVDSQVKLQNCGSSCAGENNHDCFGCWIWFEAVCYCLKTSQCKKGNTHPHFWLQVNSQLASTNLLIPNILHLQNSHAVLAASAWDFGQTASDPSNQALAINSAHSITQNQIHMHICNANTDMQKSLADLYKGHSQNTPSFYNTLKDIPNPPSGERMFCRASQNKLQPISGDSISKDINSVLMKSDICEYYVGAAVIRDDNDYSWVCVTADHLSTEVKRFCA